MSDIPINTSSFNQAYRAYAIEQGNDPTQGQSKAKDVADQAASQAALASEQAVDSAYVSPEAARLFAQQLKQRRRVNRNEEIRELEAWQSATAEENGEVPEQARPANPEKSAPIARRSHIRKD